MKLSRIFSMYLAVTGIIIVSTIASYALRSTPTSPINLGRTTISLLIVGLVLTLGISWIAYKSWHSLIFYKWLRSFSNKIRGIWGILLLIVLGLLIGGLVFVSQIYASFRPIFIWSIISLGFVMSMLTYFASEEWKYLFISIFVFIIESVSFYLIQIFLFPLENYWISILSILFCFILVEWVLIKNNFISNLFIALDKRIIYFKEIMFVLFTAILLSVAIAVIKQWMLLFVFPGILLFCLIHSCNTSIMFSIFEYLHRAQSINIDKNKLVWIITILSVFLIYSIAFFIPKTYPPSNPLFEGSYVTNGIWFTIPVNKSELFPYGYARLEDSIFDDLGKPFITALGQNLGLVEKCKFPGPDIRTFTRISSDPMVQPKYNYTVNSLCEQWNESLPSLFWRIGLIGILLLSFFIGIVIIRNPIDLLVISLLLFSAWYVWPVSDIVREGNVAVLISGIAFLGLIFPLLRKNQYSYIMIWGLLSGFLFGLASFVRQPSGYALIVTSIIAVIYSGVRQRKLFLPLFAISVLLLGYSLIPAITNGIFSYRDEKLLITAPHASPREHGSGFALLGGIGGRNSENSAKIVYENSLDIVFDDLPIWVNIYNDNPLINFSQNSYVLLQKTGQKLFFSYVLNHPIEFIFITIRKIIDTSFFILHLLKIWLLLAFLVIVMGCTREIIIRTDFSMKMSALNRMNETLFVCIILIIVTALPAVLTSPEYGESSNLPEAVIVFSGISLIYFYVKLLFNKKGF